MTPTKALQRIEWRFGGNGNKNPFPVNENDIKAYNTLEAYVHETQKKTIEVNELFAKLYVYMYMKVLEQKGSSVFDTVATKQIGNILKLPLLQVIEMLTDNLNESDMYVKFKDAGVVQKHPALRTEEENRINAEALKEIDVKDIQEAPFSLEVVHTAMIAEINNMIELYR